MFPDIEYLDWIEGRPAAATHDLGASDLRREWPEDDPVPPALDGVESPAADLETQLADVYGVATENVLVTAGATHANFLAVAAALDRAANGDGASEEAVGAGGRVLVEKPGYEPLVATPAGLGATVDRFRRPAEDGFALDPGRIAAAVMDGTACVTVTNRHNPSGRREDRETLAEASRVAADAGATLLVDEVYAPYATDPVDGAFGGPTAADLPNTVVTNSLTKFFGFGPLRVGWLVADAAFVERARTVASHVPAVASPSVALARRALHVSDELAVDSRARVATNHDLLASFVAEHDLVGEVSSGCTFGFFAHESADGDAVAQAAWEAGVLVVPGRFFADSDRFRLSLGHDPASAREGLAAFGDVLDDR
ncbi:pyridoxal phosphate-dependent aminotransferase [Halomicrococcus gelatinilyticus]|uniref:pyridoxal phosphate-dependent aminotransferase n=1 Tax=Halomicrococcus gelatinilyticus TaxID=1702103 RepID=UPI002E104812